MEVRAGILAPVQAAAEQRVDAWRVKRREALEGRIQAGLCWWANAVEERKGLGDIAQDKRMAPQQTP